MKDVDIQPWLIRMSQGDEEAFRVIYDHTRDHAYRFIYYLAPNKQEVGDIMSEVYIQLMKSLNHYDHEKKFASWFNGLIVHQVRNWKRRSWRRLRIWEKLTSFNLKTTDFVADDRVKDIHDRLEILPIIDTLSHKLKEVIVLRYYQDLSYEEISALLNIPIGTVKSRHHLALKQMRQQFESNVKERRNTNYVY